MIKIKNNIIVIIVGISLVVSGNSIMAQGQVVRDVDYISDAVYADDKDLLDIHMPQADEAVPVIVFFHGGGLRQGSKEDGDVVASRFVPLGVAVVSVSYRLSPSEMHPAHVRDAAAATAWVIRNIHKYGGDSARVYVAGHSAGAYLASLLALDPDHLGAHALGPESIRGAIAISPFLYVEETAAVRPKDVWGKDPADWLAASVTPHISAGKRPILLIYADGDADWRKRQNETFAISMREAGSESTNVIEVPQRDHMSLMSGMNDKDDRIGDLVIRFIQQQE